MKIAVGADERLNVVDVTIQYLERRGDEITWYGPAAGETDQWPDVARKVADDVALGRADEGILFCWTGTGVSIAANKVRGIRAALCDDAETARGARVWNNANVICMSMRRTSEVMVIEILDEWFATQYKSNASDDACLKLVKQLEQRRR